MKLRLLIGCIGLLPVAAVAAPVRDADLDPAEQLLFLCDVRQERLQVRAVGDHDDGDGAYAGRRVIPVVPFFGLAHGQYRTYKTRSYRCGRYRLTFSGAALNSNIQGELGAEPGFLVLAIGDGAVKVLPPTRMVMCESGGQSPRWGNCPQDYATRVDVRHSGGQSTVVVATQQIAPVLDAELVTTRRCTVVSNDTRVPKRAC